MEAAYSSGVVDDGEVSLNLARLGGLGLDEAVGLAQVLSLQLVLKGLVSGLGEHRLFLKDGQDTHGLLRNRNTSVHGKFGLRFWMSCC